MVVPEPELAPVVPPVIVPIVHEKLLSIVADKVTLGLLPLQMSAGLIVVPTGVGLTVTVIVYADPVHVPVIVVGVTIYSTVPEAVLLGLVRT